jgi:hypothetical protein
MSLQMDKILKRARLIADLGPLLLSHHAHCNMFKDHVLQIGRAKMCLGCISIYPAVAISLLLLILFRDPLNNPFGVGMLFAGGVVFTLSRFLPTHDRRIRTTFNVLTGFGTSMLLMFLFLISLPLFLKVELLLSLILISSALYYRRFLNHLNICDKRCRYQRNWKRCPGFRDIYKKIYRDLS